MATSLIRILIIYLAINTLLFMGGVRVIGEDNQNIMDRFIDSQSVLQNNQVVVSSEINASLPRTFTQSGSSLLQFIDSIGAIVEWIIFVINIVFTPLALLTSAGLPTGITLMFGIPIMISLFGGIAYFLRSGN